MQATPPPRSVCVATCSESRFYGNIWCRFPACCARTKEISILKTKQKHHLTEAVGGIKTFFFSPPSQGGVPNVPHKELSPCLMRSAALGNQQTFPRDAVIVGQMRQRECIMYSVTRGRTAIYSLLLAMTTQATPSSMRKAAVSTVTLDFIIIT